MAPVLHLIALAEHAFATLPAIPGRLAPPVDRENRIGAALESVEGRRPGAYPRSHDGARRPQSAVRPHLLQASEPSEAVPRWPGVLVAPADRVAPEYHSGA